MNSDASDPDETWPGNHWSIQSGGKSDPDF